MQAISSYFNPDQHLVFHKDKNGQMMSGGYQINNLLFENKVPLFVKMGGGGGGSGSGESRVSANIIPEKFSDLFKDLAVPAGLFMMPPLFSARNYSYEESLDDDVSKSVKSGDGDSDSEGHDSDSDSDFYEENRSHRDRHHHTHPHRFAPVDIFDKLLALVAPSDRIKIDKKTRKSRHSDNDKPVQKSIKSTNKTRRSKAT
jgi:hypothetical protein